MGLKVKNIYDGYYLYIFMTIILFFLEIKTPKFIIDIIKESSNNPLILLIISIIILLNMKVGILVTLIYINILFNKNHIINQ
jgi:hypothetical protein